MDQLFHEIRGTLQEMQGLINANTRDLQVMTSRTQDLGAAVSRLEGAFAGIERILSDHEKRISTLEHKLPPAA